MYDWLLFLHVLAAFLAVTAIVLLGGLLVLGASVAAQPPTLRRLLRLALVLWAVGSVGVLVLGIWLAIYVDGYELWDGWIAAALVLWLVAGAASGRVSRAGAAALRAASAADDAATASFVALNAYAVMAV